MSARSVLVLLRFPFALFLAPIALFGLVAVMPLDPVRVFLILVSIHVFLYPASNGINSYYDRDLGPIGGVLNPPMPTKGLLRASLLMDAGALLVGLLVSPWYALGLFLYGLSSKAYSWDRLRLKSRPIISLLMISLGQGAVIFLLSAWFASAVPYLPSVLGQFANEPYILKGAAVGNFLGPIGVIFSPRLIFGAVLSACFLCGIYPLTQVYQHDEDEARGDLTFSRLVGIRGTFRSSALFFALTGLGMTGFFLLYDTWLSVVVFAVCMLPGMVIFLFWWRAVVKNPEHASFSWMMRMNLSTSGGMNLFLMLELIGLPHIL